VTTKRRKIGIKAHRLLEFISFLKNQGKRVLEDDVDVALF